MVSAASVTPAMRLSPSVRGAILVVALGAALLIVLRAPVGSAPDEPEHLAAVAWFQGHLWPPAPDEPGLWRSSYGTSRAISGEWPYWLLGQIAPVTAGPICIRAFQPLALAALLAPLLFWPSRLFRLDLAALFVSTVPQVIYLASYVNSDLWAIASATWLLRAALAIFEEARRRDCWLFGSALGLTLGAKPNAWLVVPFAVALALARPEARATKRWIGPLLLALALVAPLRVVYPWTQHDFPTARGAARSAHARPDLDPEHPQAPGFRLRQQGASLWRSVVARPDWWKRTAGSTYAFFGSMDILPATPLFVLAATAWLLLLGIHFGSARRTLARGDPRWRILAGCALLLASLVAASLGHSWVDDYQPQGRYLFPALLPFALLLVGIETDRAARRWRDALLVFVAALATVVLATTVPRLAG